MREKLGKLITSKKFTILISFLGLYLLSAGTSWAIFSYLRGEPSAITGSIADRRMRIDEGLPKTQECPINGAFFTEPEREIWEGRRPITAIIENHVDSRPQSGLSKADVIYEAVAEGGITRFVSVFYCGASSEDTRIGPIRSARVYFINWAAEYGEEPLFVHVGGANNICNNCPGGVKPPGTVAKNVLALEQLINMGWRYTNGNALDAGTNIGTPVVWRDYQRIPGAATEHTFMGSTDKLFEVGEKRGFGYEGDDGDPWTEEFVSWKFADESPTSSSATERISFKFWNNKPDYDVSWTYDSESNRYLRWHGNDKHIDMDNEEQLAAKNVVIQFVEELGPVDKEGHMFYTTIGEGEALIFKNGNVIEGSWEKPSRLGRTKFFDGQGREIEFVRGVVFIEAVPIGNEIDY